MGVKYPVSGGLQGRSRELLGRLLPGLQALRAEVKVLLDSILDHSHTLYVCVPAALRVAHGMADVIPKLWPLATLFTLGHWCTPLDAQSHRQTMTEPGWLGQRPVYDSTRGRFTQTGAEHCVVGIAT